VKTHLLEREQMLHAPVDRVFEFFSEARNLERITPGWLHFEVQTPAPITMAAGTEIRYRLRIRGVPLRWISRIELWERNAAFVDVQLSGPYRLWHHRHEFTAVGENTLVRDRVHYALPFGVAGELAHLALVRRDLDRIFDHRHSAVAGAIG
jgi:ligand-binding SRPBCC domain-containing protein